MKMSLRTLAFFLLMAIILVVPSTLAEVKEATVTIDATNREAFAFFSFDTGKEVPVEDQNISLDWEERSCRRGA